MLDISKRIINKFRRYLHFRPILANAEKNTKQLLEKSHYNHVLVICYGNIYRSPFVENYIKIKLQNTSIEVRSAGTYPKTGRSSPEKHIQMSREFGIDLSEHTSEIADEKLLKWADIIVIMDRHNWDELGKYGQDVLNKIVWLGSLSGDYIEIKDPYAQNEQQARNILSQLQYSSDRLLEYIS